jgi:hypothetical protein
MAHATTHRDLALKVYRGAIDDIVTLLATRTPAEAKLSAIGQVITEQIPPGPGNYLQWPPARVAPGSTWGEVAGMIAAYLRWNPAPATLLLSELAGTQIRPLITGSALRKLGDGECDDPERLQAAYGDQVYERTATMFADGAGSADGADSVVCAHTRLLLLPERLPPEAWRQILAGQPCGAVLAAYGMRRGRRTAEPYAPDDGPPGVAAEAGLSIGAVVVGEAAEYVPASFCRHLAERTTPTEGKEQP